MQSQINIEKSQHDSNKNNQKVYELFTYDEYNIYAYCNEYLWFKKYVEGSYSGICVISKEDFVNGDFSKFKEIFAYEED